MGHHHSMYSRIRTTKLCKCAYTLNFSVLKLPLAMVDEKDCGQEKLGLIFHWQLCFCTNLFYNPLTLRPLIYCMFFSTYYLYNINFIITVNDLINQKTRLAVHKQSFSNLLERNGCRVTKVYYSKILGISKKEQFILFFLCQSVCVFHIV